jgi:hypothetical protein
VSTNPTVWITAILALGIYSFLVKDNPFFRIVEKLFVGLGAGYYAALGVRSIIQLGIAPLGEGKWVTLIPLALGVMVFARFVKPIAWVSKIPVAVIVAVGAALTLRGSAQAQFMTQIVGTMQPLNSIDNVILVFGTMAVLLYFFFKKVPEGPAGRTLGLVRSVARVLMMVSFGIGFGGMIGTQIPRAIGQVQLIFGKWIHIIPGF